MTSDRVHGCLVLSVVGEVDAFTAPLLRAAVSAGIDENGLVVVDLTKVSFLGSAGLAMLVDAVRDAKQHDTSLRIVVGYTRSVVRPLEVTGLDTVLPVFVSVQEAVAQ